MTIPRREFLSRLATASAVTIVPRRVLGGRGYIAPSDMLLIAQVGCGTQSFRQVSTNLARRPDLQFVAVVDPNRSSDDYVDWSPFGVRATVRRFLGDPTWCEGDRATRCGREVAKSVMETWYRKENRPAAGIRAYEDFREMLDRETDLQGIVNITPDHQHGPINIAALRRNVAAISHKPVAATMHEVQRTLAAARESRAPSHLLAYSNRPDRHTLAAWIAAGAIGTVREVHNWTDRPFWPQGMQGYPVDTPPVPDGFNWALWQGAEPDRPYNPAYTFSVYRGWYAYGTGCLGDMGHYSLWQPYRILELAVPEWVEARPSNDASVGANRVSGGGEVSQVAFPKASSVRWRHPATTRRPSVDTFWYDGGMKPPTPDALIEDGEDFAAEGMLIVGDAGAILCDFRANAPRLIPKKRHQAFEGSVPVPSFDATSADDEWVGAIKRGGKSKGSFEAVEPLAQAVAMAGIALRVPYKRLSWDAGAARFTNSEEANRLLRRPAWRQGWDTLVG
ncbi:Oxidoreductase family, NAD-binding Rossmann fold [Luteitalea pratensis]|uniref:Oxidoreductase family, NAD-binding Rossmann fold n=1 Tax=Luteitalea pratensis TaxID=1855912 RepID=A0A143PV17_LUTPR|nr:Gfo/Idh/MocA family oxidoreductase [Luteitalea pratensis]AMY12422.1 Oxidoreductase family, NAD-binding Rossmann fold [Luteitalea pratensis]